MRARKKRKEITDKANVQKLERHEKAREKEIIIIVENEKTSSSMETSRAYKIKLSHRNVKKYKGVRLRKRGKWVVEVRDSKMKTGAWLGIFNTAEEAALAYDKTIIG
ncbi:hypothetical protein RDI58_000442 [Solanum bulbocastanum]|uniref:AP2/ERF domain-containing protein n=1 Tax=Solanum bulbocastanum TaxID=147425 RepID=A0AAN8UAF0_SOLBU